MTEEEFYNLSKPQLLEGAKICIENAHNLYEGAISLELKKSIGPANSLMILSIEEYIKAFVLVAGYCDIELDFKVKPIFRHHQEKHKLGVEILPILRLVEVVSDLFDMKKSVFNKVMSTLICIQLTWSPKRKKEIQEWWEKANNEKNNGLYVGFRNNKWKSPSDFSEEFYQQSKVIAGTFKNASKSIESLRSDDYKSIQLK